VSYVHKERLLQRREHQCDRPSPAPSATTGTADIGPAAVLSGSAAQCSHSARKASRLLLSAIAVAILAAVVFLSNPDIDLGISALFLDGNGRFIGRRQVLVEQTRDALMWLPYALGGICLTGLLVSRLRRTAWLYLRFSQWVFLALCVAVGPGLIVNVALKEHWGRARPSQIIEYGGSKTFSPPLRPADQCAKNCSFVSGEASSVFMIFYAVALIFPHRFAVLIVAGTLAGMAIGVMRMSQGAHFLSDIVFAGIFMALAAAILHVLLFGARGSRAASGMFARRAARRSAPEHVRADDGNPFQAGQLRQSRDLLGRGDDP
jgi:lipid A 4'-phosphatase